MKKIQVNSDRIIDQLIKDLKINTISQPVLMNDGDNVYSLCRISVKSDRHSSVGDERFNDVWFWAMVGSPYNFAEGMNYDYSSTHTWAIKQAMREGWEIIVFDNVKEYAIYLIEWQKK